jgi:hypothetical protein
MKAYEEDSSFLYDGGNVLVEYDLIWKTSTIYNDKGDMEDLTMFFKEVPTLKGFEKIAKKISEIIHIYA